MFAHNLRRCHCCPDLGAKAGSGWSQDHHRCRRRTRALTTMAGS